MGANTPQYLNADVQTEHCLAFANDMHEFLKQLRRDKESLKHAAITTMLCRCEVVQQELEEVKAYVAGQQVRRELRKRQEACV